MHTSTKRLSLLILLQSPTFTDAHAGHFTLGLVQIQLSALPSRSLRGDAQLLLDGGTTLSAHSVYLQDASEVFSDVLDSTSPAPEQPNTTSTSSAAPEPEGPAKRARTETKIPLPGILACLKHSACLAF